MVYGSYFTIVRWGYVHQLVTFGGTTLYVVSWGHFSYLMFIDILVGFVCLKIDTIPDKKTAGSFNSTCFLMIHVCVYACLYIYIHEHIYIYTYSGYMYIYMCYLCIAIQWYTHDSFISGMRLHAPQRF